MRGFEPQDVLAPALWFLVGEAGHPDCGGWTLEERDGLLRCACGNPLYVYRRVAPAPARVG